MATDTYFGSRQMALGTGGAEQIYNAFMGYLIATNYRILSRTISDPPALPSLLDTYLVPAGATNDWSAYDGQFVFWQNGWVPVQPQAGMGFFVADEDVWVQMHTNIPANANAVNGTHDIPLVLESGAYHIKWDGSKATTANVTLTQDAIFDTPTNFVAGQNYMLRVTQDGTGLRNLDPQNNGFVVGPGNGSPLSAIDTLTAGQSADIYLLGPQGALAKPTIYLVILDTQLVNVV